MKPDELLTDDSFLAWYYKTDPEAVRLWEDLIKNDPLLRASSDEAVAFLKQLPADDESVVSAEQVAEAQRVLMGRVADWERGRSLFSRRRLLFRLLPIAASVAVVLGIVWYRATAKQGPVYTASAKMTEYVLADGTKVKLNKGSRLEVNGLEPEQKGNREVWLSGEAFFDVSHMTAERRFIVHTDAVEVTVLGTRFNVRTLSSNTSVALESGKVELVLQKEGSQKLVMQPGELVEYSGATGVVVRKDVNVTNYSAWRAGKVIFENARLPEIEKTLFERFGLEVEVEAGGDLGEFNGTFPSDDPSLLIQALEKAYPDQVVRTQKGVRISKIK